MHRSGCFLPQISLELNVGSSTTVRKCDKRSAIDRFVGHPMTTGPSIPHIHPWVQQSIVKMLMMMMMMLVLVLVVVVEEEEEVVVFICSSLIDSSLLHHPESSKSELLLPG